MKSKFIKIVIFVFAVLISGFFGAFISISVIKDDPEKFGLLTINKLEKEVTVTDNGIAEAVDKVYDSVVVVESYYRNRLVSTGTGFIYGKKDKTYYIVTNYHVISNADVIKVVLTNNVEVDVTRVGGDMYSDVALLSYETDEELEIAPIGASLSMNVGDTVFAIGAPLDSSVYSWSVTRGILSGKDREVRVSSDDYSNRDFIMNVLQTDAAINSGNSGGPLCNINGEVVGITNMKLVTTGVEGMGFAIPIEEAKVIIDALINGEEIFRPYLGIYMTDVNKYNQNYYDLSSDSYGVYVTDVEDSSLAMIAGIKKGDIIIAINDVKITDIATFRYQIYKYKDGDTITIKYMRDGAEKSTNVKIQKTD